MWNKKALYGFVFLFLGLLGTFSLFSMPADATGGINPSISFEGKIVNNNGTNITDGTYNMEFKIYSGASNVGTGDTLLFTEDWLVGSTQGGVALTSGTYEVNLGTAGSGDSVALSSLNWNQYPLWLSLQIGNTSACTITTNFQANCGGDTEMKPYIELTSTPYSFTADQIGYTNGGFVGTLSFASTLSGTDTITIPDTGGSGGTICLQNASACGFAPSTNSGNYIQNQSATPQTGASFDVADTGTIGGLTTLNGGLTVNTATATDISVTSGTNAPTADQLNITNTGSTAGVTTAGVNALSINYKGGAAAVEAAAERIDLQPGTTTGGTWDAVRLVANATGPATGVTETGLKVEGPTTGGAGTFNAVNVLNVGAVTTGGTVNGINITGTNSNAAGTVNGININNLTGGGATENAINIGTGWDNIIQSTNFSVTGAGAVTAAGNLQVGSGTANTNSVLIENNNYDAVLGTEPSVVNGAMYYNSTIDQFRCGVNGTWENCGGLDISNSATKACTVSTTATSCVPNNYFTSAAPSIPANYCTVGRVIHVFVSGIYTGVTTASSITFSIRLGTTIIGAASGLIPTGTTASMQWNINFYITCDSTTTVTGEGDAQVYTTSIAAGNGSLTGTGTTTVTNTSAQSIEPYINVATTADVSSITLEQFIVQGM